MQALLSPVDCGLTLSGTILIRCPLDQNSAAVTLTKLQNPVKQSFENINSDLKEVYKGLNSYTKALDKVFVLQNHFWPITDAGLT